MVGHYWYIWGGEGINGHGDFCALILRLSMAYPPARPDDPKFGRDAQGQNLNKTKDPLEPTLQPNPLDLRDDHPWCHPYLTDSNIRRSARIVREFGSLPVNMPTTTQYRAALAEYGAEYVQMGTPS